MPSAFCSEVYDYRGFRVILRLPNTRRFIETEMLTAVKKQRVSRQPIRKITGNWWVFLFIVATYFFYSHSIQKKRETIFDLNERFQELEQEKALALHLKEDLLMQVRSQSDPVWIEMTLMKGLGLVPEGQRKVYFKH